ncbi:MAG: hypothetical protein U0P30_13895 [Vicinamibacterales bacterium]
MPEIPIADYRVDVDERGFLSDTVFEGALGFVARIKALDRTPRALKIPRLLADTDRENHYVCSLTDYEIRNAGLVVAQPGLTSLDFGGRSLLRSVSYAAGKQEAVLVQFSKELKPRFCLVSADIAQGAMVFTPHIEALAAWLTIDVWRSAVELCQGGHEALTSTVVIRRSSQVPQALAAGEAFLLVQQQPGREQTGFSEDRWYLGLPSPVYFWRAGTLEQAVRKNQRGIWQWDDHCALATQLARGLVSLYHRGFVHGDLRPANVMYAGDPTVSGDYALIDYASYSGLAGAIGNPVPTDDPGQTLIGVAVAEARQSPFYPVERRVGRERENCDTVVIRRADGHWILHVGYRSDLFDRGGDLVAAVQEQMKDVLKGGSRGSVSEWKAGDRIRVRDFVFQVDGWREGPQGFTIAGQLAWLVHNNRILVPLSADAFEDKDRVLSVSRTFPIWQWSMATDFFSLGVSLLYSLFFTANTSSDEVSRHAELDNEFEAMVAVMSTVQYAGVILPNVARVARLLEKIWSDEEFRDQDVYTPRQIASLKLSDESGGPSFWGPTNGRAFASEVELKDHQYLLGRTWAIAMSVVQTTPGTERILKAVNRNLAIFVCLIDLCMQLMHRREDFGEHAGSLMAWMCDDRTAPPNADKATAVIDYIGRAVDGLMTRFQNAKHFECPSDSVLGYTSRNETLLRIQLRQFEDRARRLEDKNVKLESDIVDLRTKVVAAKGALERLYIKNSDVKQVLSSLRNFT